MTQSSSGADAPEAGQETVPGSEEGMTDAQRLASEVAEAVGASGWSAEHGNVKVVVAPDRWRESIATARDELGLTFFSWLSAIDWSNEVAVGDPPEEGAEEGLEVLCRLSTLTDGNGATFSTRLSPSAPRIASLVEVFPGADWHERECHEMFGIDFEGHPNQIKLYLPDGFEGHPLRKSFPLLTREVKPWPGKVDVEDMPPDVEEAQRAAYGGDGGDEE